MKLTPLEHNRDWQELQEILDLVRTLNPGGSSVPRFRTPRRHAAGEGHHVLTRNYFEAERIINKLLEVCCPTCPPFRLPYPKPFDRRTAAVIGWQVTRNLYEIEAAVAKLLETCPDSLRDIVIIGRRSTTLALGGFARFMAFDQIPDTEFSTIGPTVGSDESSGNPYIIGWDRNKARAAMVRRHAEPPYDLVLVDTSSEDGDEWTQSVVRTFDTFPEGARWVPPDGQEIAFLWPDGSLSAYDTTSWAPTWSLSLDDGAALVKWFSFDAERRWLAVSTEDDTNFDRLEDVRLYDTATGALAGRQLIDASIFDCREIEFAKDDTEVWFAGHNGAMRVYSVPDLTFLRSVGAGDRPCFAVSPDDAWAFGWRSTDFGSDTSKYNIWDYETGDLVHEETISGFGAPGEVGDWSQPTDTGLFVITRGDLDFSSLSSFDRGVWSEHNWKSTAGIRYAVVRPFISHRRG